MFVNFIMNLFKETPKLSLNIKNDIILNNDN